MRESNRINRDALESVQRAFIGSPTITDKEKIVDGNTKKVVGIQFSLAWQNSGTTQARDFRICSSREDAPIGSSENLPDKCGQPFRDVATPKRTVISRPIVLQAPLLESLIEGRTKVTIWGWVKYRDVFPNTPEHVTRYCVELSGVLGYNNSDLTTPFAFQQAGCTNSYSCVDEECTAAH